MLDLQPGAQVVPTERLSATPRPTQPRRGAEPASPLSWLGEAPVAPSGIVARAKTACATYTPGLACARGAVTRRANAAVQAAATTWRARAIELQGYESSAAGRCSAAVVRWRH